MSESCFMSFEKLGEDGKARRGRLTFPRGVVETPAFMPVGTYGTVKGMLPRDIEEIGAHIILGNTFHLMLRPGTEVVKAHGDLHDFTQWQGPILTDSGGFQVFSLGEMRKITEQGVTFRSPVDGSKVELSPEIAIQVQRDLGSDIVMIFDECTPYPATEKQAKESMELSLRWAERSKRAHEGNPAALFGIVQGGMYESLRDQSLVAHGLDVALPLAVRLLRHLEHDAHRPDQTGHRGQDRRHHLQQGLHGLHGGLLCDGLTLDVKHEVLRRRHRKRRVVRFAAENRLLQLS